MSNFYGKNLRFTLVFCWLAVLKTAQPNLLLATFEGSFFIVVFALKSYV